MRTRVAACTALLTLAAALTACSSSSHSKADPSACKAAMTKQLREGMAKGKDAPEGKKPAACNGLDDKTLERLGKEILAKELPKAVASALPKAIESDLATATETSNVTPECRAWIEKELRDSSDRIDGASGEAACGYLSKDEIDQAIQDVTDDLMKQGATPSS